MKKTHAYLLTIVKGSVKFQKERPKTVGVVAGTNPEPRITESGKQYPSAFLRKGEGQFGPLKHAQLDREIFVICHMWPTNDRAMLWDGIEWKIY